MFLRAYNFFFPSSVLVVMSLSGFDVRIILAYKMSWKVFFSVFWKSSVELVLLLPQIFGRIHNETI